MIAKKIENPKKSSSKRERITALLEYIYAPEREDTEEKCTHAGGVNFLSEDTAGRIGEMLAVAHQAPRSRDPVEHYVFSWPEDEEPEGEHVDALIATLRREMSRRGKARDRAAAERLLIAYALHEDTDHHHVHVVVLRVDPETGRPVEINRGFDRDLIQRVAAQVEHTQNWRPTKNKRFRVGPDGQVVPTDPNPEAPDRPRASETKKPPQQVRDRSHRKGEPSVLERAIEKLAPIFENAGPWNEPGGLNEQLAAAGAEYRLKGGGAVVDYEGVTMRASSISRQASPRALEKRFGQPYEPPREAALTPELQAIAATPPPGDGPPLAAAPPPPAPPDEIDPVAVRAILQVAEKWPTLHEALRRAGYRYERKGSGAIIRAGNLTMRASQIWRGASLAHMERRLGKFQPAPPEPGAIDPKAPLAAERAAFAEAEHAQAIEQELAESDARHRDADARRAQKERHAAEREQAAKAATATQPDDAPAIDNLARALAAVHALAERQAAEREALRRRQQRASKARQRRRAPALVFDQWLHRISAWCRRLIGPSEPADRGPATQPWQPVPCRRPPAIRHALEHRGVRRRDGTVAYLDRKGVARFIDNGDRLILLQDPPPHDALADCLLLLPVLYAEREDALEFRGPKEVCARVDAIAGKRGQRVITREHAHPVALAAERWRCEPQLTGSTWTYTIHDRERPKWSHVIGDREQAAVFMATVLAPDQAAPSLQDITAARGFIGDEEGRVRQRARVPK